MNEFIKALSQFDKKVAFSWYQYAVPHTWAKYKRVQ